MFGRGRKEKSIVETEKQYIEKYIFLLMGSVYIQLLNFFYCKELPKLETKYRRPKLRLLSPQSAMKASSLIVALIFVFVKW